MHKNLRLTVLLFSFVCFTKVGAQYVNIPDTNFVNWLNGHGYSQCLSGSQLDTTCPAVLTTTKINFLYAPVTDLTGLQYFKNLDTLLAQNCNITNVPSFPNTITWLWIGNNYHLTNLPALPTSLKRFDCSDDSLTSLPALPASLTDLAFIGNYITTIPTLPPNLVSLSASGNPITVLPSLPSTVKYLYIDHTFISSLPTLPTGLNLLNCDNTHLTSIPTLPTGLQNLSIGGSFLTAIPVIPDSVQYLYIRETGFHSLSLNWPPHLIRFELTSNKVLDSVPPLPSYLKYLIINGSYHLLQLPAFPVNLNSLDLSTDSIRFLPDVPPYLTYLNLSFNQLTALPAIPQTVYTFDCQSNLLTTLPSLPPFLNFFNCSNNTGLTCLPALTRINNMYFSGTAVTCVPNYGQVTSSTPALTTLPLCDPGNSYGCQSYFNISGSTFRDLNSNCIYDAGDSVYANMKVLLKQGNRLLKQTFSQYSGQYSFKTDTLGIYNVTVDTSYLPFTMYCPTGGARIDTLTTIDSIKTKQNFSFRCPGTYDLAVMGVVSGLFVPDRTNDIRIIAGDLSNLYNGHCATGASGTVTVVLSGPFSIISSSGDMAPTSIIGDTVVWNVTDFGQINVLRAFGIKVKTDYNAPGGSLVCASIDISPSNDNNPSNNSIDLCTITLAAWDPNHKEVSPAGNIDTAQKWLTYTVHFQNTGTYYAQNIHVDDTLDINKYDISSVQLLAYSYPPVVDIQSNGAMRFNFYGINLPDSTMDFDGSQGYVQYKVKLKEGLAVGTQVNNTASIYFDFNPAVVTNTASNTIALHIATNTNELADNLSLQLYPNPTNGILYLKPVGFTPETISIYDISGQKLREEKYNSQIYINTLSTGCYFIEVRSGNNVVRRRFVKM